MTLDEAVWSESHSHCFTSHGKSPLVPVGLESGWTPQPIWR